MTTYAPRLDRPTLTAARAKLLQAAEDGLVNLQTAQQQGRDGQLHYRDRFLLKSRVAHRGVATTLHWLRKFGYIEAPGWGDFTEPGTQIFPVRLTAKGIAALDQHTRSRQQEPVVQAAWTALDRLQHSNADVDIEAALAPEPVPAAPSQLTALQKLLAAVAEFEKTGGRVDLTVHNLTLTSSSRTF